MGDRANVVIRDEHFRDLGDREAVFLYGHWSGHELPETLRRALAKHWRWNDSAYLARIVFDEMVGGAQGGETSFGISTRPPDNEYDFLVLRVREGQLCRLAQDEWSANAFATLDAAPAISFEDYVAAPERTWENLTDAPVVA